MRSIPLCSNVWDSSKISQLLNRNLQLLVFNGYVRKWDKTTWTSKHPNILWVIKSSNYFNYFLRNQQSFSIRWFVHLTGEKEQEWLKCVTSLGLAHSDPSVTFYDSAGTLCHEEPKSAQGFTADLLQAEQAWHFGETADSAGVQMVPKWLWARKGPEKCWSAKLGWAVGASIPQKDFLLAEEQGSGWAAQEAQSCCGAGCLHVPWIHPALPLTFLPLLQKHPLSTNSQRELNRVAHSLCSCKTAGGDCELLNQWTPPTFHASATSVSH